MRYLPRSPLLPSPTRTSPRSSPNWERCSRLALLCLSRSCQLLTVTVAAPALQMDCPNLLCFSCSCPTATSPFPFFLILFFLYSYQPLSLQMDCPNLFALATCYRPLFTAPLCRRTAPISSSYYSYSACSADGLPPFLALHSFRLLSHTPAAAAGG